MTGAALQTASNIAGVTQFLRPEDGAWDPTNPQDFYFVTTNSFSSPSRLWKLHFSNLNDLTQGGTITAVLDGTEGHVMLDNITIDSFGNILMQEDVGNNARLGKTWQYKIATDELKEIASHDASRFLIGGANYIGTQDEEGSGIIDAQHVLGAGMFLLVDQAHHPMPGEIYEGGQLLAMNVCASFSGNISVAPSPTVANQMPNTVYLGYGPQSVTLSTTVSEGFGPYTYSWSNGAATSAITVAPTATTTYTVTIRNAFGCETKVNHAVNVIDIRDGNKDKVFICHKGKTISVSVNAVPAHLKNGANLAACTGMNAKGGLHAEETDMQQATTLYPNPTRTSATLSFNLQKDENVMITVVNLEGKVVMQPLQNSYKAGKQAATLNISQLPEGTYFVQVSYGTTSSKIKMIVVR
jgi:hypothetical protein